MKEAKLHITDKEMQLYIRNQLSDYERERVELEIQLCETCLQSFIHWNSVEQLLHIPQVDEAAEQIMTRIEMETTQHKRQKRKWIQHPLAQVAVAASITLLLVGSGAMGVISNSLSGLEEASMTQPIQQQADYGQGSSSDNEGHDGNGQNGAGQSLDGVDGEQHQSSSERWLNKASRWLEKIEERRFNQNE